MHSFVRNLNGVTELTFFYNDWASVKEQQPGFCLPTSEVLQNALQSLPGLKKISILYEDGLKDDKAFESWKADLLSKQNSISFTHERASTRDSLLVWNRVEPSNVV